MVKLTKKYIFKRGLICSLEKKERLNLKGKVAQINWYNLELIACPPRYMCCQFHIHHYASGKGD